MKTDRFTDIIRRKLESIRPEFTEKDWARMQTSLQQVSPPQPGGIQQPFTTTPGGWVAQPWLLAAAAVSTVVLMAVGMWQRQEINTLRETVQQLNRTSGGRLDSTRTAVASTEPRPAELTAKTMPSANRSGGIPTVTAGQERVTDTRRDTVYITRYVTAPARPDADNSSRPAMPRRFDAFTDRLAASQPARNPDRTAPVTTDSKTDVNPVLNDRSSTLTRSGSRSTAVPSTSSMSLLAEQQLRSQARLTGRATDAYKNPVADRADASVTAAATSVTDSADASTETAASFERLAGLSLSLKNTDWSRALAQRTRRMRPARTITIGGQAKPENQPESQSTPFIARFRTGVSSDLEAHTWSIGVAGEVLLGKHLALGAGLSRATHLSGLFLTDVEFNNRTQRDFRREFARGIDPKRDILNIDTRTIRLQIPVSLGYRVPLGQSLAVTPTVGTYLNLSSSENITFYYSDMPRGFSEARYKTDLPNCLVNNVTVGTNVEWQRGHWVGQAGPLVSIPTQPSFGWSRNTTLGARLRVLYQF